MAIWNIWQQRKYQSEPGHCSMSEVGSGQKGTVPTSLLFNCFWHLMKEIKQQRKAFWKKKNWFCLYFKYSGDKGRDEFSPVAYYQEIQNSQENQSLQYPSFLVPYTPKLHKGPAKRPKLCINTLLSETMLWIGPEVGDLWQLVSTKGTWVNYYKLNKQKKHQKHNTKSIVDSFRTQDT